MEKDPPIPQRPDHGHVRFLPGGNGHLGSGFRQEFSKAFPNPSPPQHQHGKTLQFLSNELHGAPGGDGCIFCQIKGVLQQIHPRHRQIPADDRYPLWGFYGNFRRHRQEPMGGLGANVFRHSHPRLQQKPSGLLRGGIAGDDVNLHFVHDHPPSAPTLCVCSQFCA